MIGLVREPHRGKGRIPECNYADNAPDHVPVTAGVYPWPMIIRAALGLPLLVFCGCAAPPPACP